MDQITLFQVAIWCLRQQADDTLVPMISNLEQRVAALVKDHEDKLHSHVEQVVDMIKKGYSISTTPVDPEKKVNAWP